MINYYKLVGKEPEPCSMEEYAKTFELNRIVKKDRVGVVDISTVFLGINHQIGDDAPLLFETMIFGGPHNEYQERCATYDEAEEMHKRALQKVLETP